IDAAGQSADDVLVADELADLRDLALHERARRPVRRGLADAEEEVADDLRSANRVRDLGVELERVNGLRRVTEARDDDPTRRGAQVSRRRLVHVIAMAHPDLRLLALREPLEHSRALVHRDRRAPVLAAAPGRDLSALG